MDDPLQYGFGDMGYLVSREERAEIAYDVVHSALPEPVIVLIQRLLWTLDEKDAEMELVRADLAECTRRVPVVSHDDDLDDPYGDLTNGP